MAVRTTVLLDKELLEELLEAARLVHPREVLLILRGTKRRFKNSKEIVIRDYLVPPFSILGETSAVFRLSMIPPDPDIVGLIHSHPTGNIIPSRADLENFIGEFVAVMAYPYAGRRNVAVYDKDGQILDLRIV